MPGHSLYERYKKSEGHHWTRTVRDSSGPSEDNVDEQA
jgi:hypothetical protein